MGNNTTLRPTLFIDRDGTVNRHVGYLTKPEQLELLPGVGAAIRKLNQGGVLAVIVTNQAVVARGDCTAAELDAIHARLEALLKGEGAFLDGIYACPHHPDAGEGGIPELKVACTCRKPEPGLVHRAMRDLPIDLNRSAVVGDSARDVELAARIGRPAYYISSTSNATSASAHVTPVLSLEEAAQLWLGH